MRPKKEYSTHRVPTTKIRAKPKDTSKEYVKIGHKAKDKMKVKKLQNVLPRATSLKEVDFSKYILVTSGSSSAKSL